jgi:hypothetical protein
MIQSLETLEDKSANYEPFAEPFIAGAGTVCRGRRRPSLQQSCSALTNDADTL